MDWLLSTLIADYDILQHRLGAHLGSRELAAEALHDVYLKLRSNPHIEVVRHPRPYLYRMSINMMLNHRRKNDRLIALDNDFTLAIPDDAPSPEHVVLASDELDRAVNHLHELPDQRRLIFLAKWRDGKTQIQIAADFGLHKRTVQKELDRAERHLRKMLLRPTS